MNRRIHLLTMAGLAVLLVAAGLFYYLYTAELLIEQLRTRGTADIAQIHREILAAAGTSGSGEADSGNAPEAAGSEEESEFALPPSWRNLQEIALRQGEIIPAHIVIVDSRSRLLADSHRRTEDVAGRFITADLSGARETGTASSAVRVVSGRQTAVSVARRLSTPEGDLIVSLSYRMETLRQFQLAFLVLTLSFLLITAVQIALMVSYSLRQYRHPIRTLLEYTQEAARGGFNKIHIQSENQELSGLAASFNSLVDRYNQLILSDNRKYSRINTLLANLHSGILMVDPENRVTLVNPRAEEMLNLDKLDLFRDREEFRTRNPLLIRILEETAGVNRHRRDVRFTLNTPSGKILDAHIQAVFSKYVPFEHSGALAILMDVTEMRRMEQLKDEFVSNVSHEFRTPLTVISGFVETLKSWELLDGKDRDTALELIGLETDRLKTLVSELLRLSRVDRGAGGEMTDSYSPGEITREAVSRLQPLCSEKEIQSVLNIAADVPDLRGIAGWFRQILLNVYDNALKYTPRGGRVEVLLKPDGSGAGRGILLEVRDSGPGIPADQQERIFERFYRGDKSRGSRIPGSGLGLSIARQMVTEMGGTIEVESGDGEGALFRIRLPGRNT